MYPAEGTFFKKPEKATGNNIIWESPDVEIAEWDTRYKINLQLNRDCSFYLDSSLLRKWLLKTLPVKGFSIHLLTRAVWEWLL
jgi:23S rRNA G2069 N7-methylase RlmK/C1962 C5-methylase RlmI